VGSRAVLDAVVKRKITTPCPGLEPPVIQPVAIPLSYPGFCFTYIK
jgi:hypothetical protein